MAKNLCSAFMKLDVSEDYINSMWMAFMVMQVNSTAQRLLLVASPFVRLVLTIQVPKASKPA